MVDVEVSVVFAISTACEVDKSGCLQEDPSGFEPKTAVVYDVMRVPLLLGANSPAALESSHERGSQSRICSMGFRS